MVAVVSTMAKYYFCATGAGNSYTASKAAASISLLQWAEEFKLNLNFFDIPCICEEKNKIWPSLKKAALSGKDFPMTGGEQIRDFAPVESVAKLFLHHA